VEKPGNEEEDSEVPSLPLGLTGNILGVFQCIFLEVSCFCCKIEGWAAT
jgi:hypothetical protein